MHRPIENVSPGPAVALNRPEYIHGEPKQYPNMKVTAFQKCSFVKKTTGQNLLDMQQIDGNMNFVNEFCDYDFIIKLIECSVPPFLCFYCDVGIIIWFTLQRISFPIF